MDYAAIDQSLRATAYVMLPPLTDAERNEVLGYLLSRPVFPGSHIRVAAQKNSGILDPVSRDTVPNDSAICISLRDAILTPVILEKAMALTDFVSGYLGRDPALSYSANSFYTRPAQGPTRPDIQEFHRDADDPAGFLAMFVYLTDVLNDEQGPHDIIGPDGVMRTIYGPAGTMFLAQTSHEHRGRRPLHGERGIAWWRWCVSNPPDSYLWDQNSPISASELGDRYPSDPRLRESLRLLVTTDLAPPQTVRMQARMNGKPLAVTVQG